MTQERLKTPTLEDKWEFFAQLDAVYKRTDNDQDDEDPDLKALGDLFRNAKPPQRKPSRRSTTVSKPEPTKKIEEPKKPELKVPVLEVPPVVKQAQKEVARISSFETPRRPLSTTEVDFVPDTVLPRRRHTSPNMSARAKQSRRRGSDAEGVTPSRPGPGKRRKTEPAPPMVPLEKQVFNGLTFFYVPNDTINKFRQMLQDQAVKYGAVCLQEWSPLVTHLIVHTEYNFTQALLYLKLDKISENIVVVNATYQSDCVQFNRLLNPTLSKFTVKGHTAPTPNPPAPVPAPEERPSPTQSVSDSSLVIKDKKRKPELEETPRSGENSSSEGPVKAKDLRRTNSDFETGLKFVRKVKEDVFNIPKPVQLQARPTLSSVGKKDSLEELIEVAQKGHAEFIDELQESESHSDSSDDARSGSDDEAAPISSRAQIGRLRKRKNPEDFARYFQCFQKHDGTENNDNPNKMTIDTLSELQKYYEKMNDTWRSIGYRKAIATLKKQPTKVVFAKDAKKLHGIGERIADKIEEIALTNHLRRLEYARQDDGNSLLSLFMGVYGVGTVQAQQWVSAGYTSLDDLYKRAALTPSQKVGVEHYQDFAQRIPRAEVKQHGDTVFKAAHDLDPALILDIMGSYRRGAPDCGDIDIIITKRNADATELNGVLEQLVKLLFERNFLCVGLATPRKSDGSKWHGASKIAKDAPWRRIDFLAVPWKERGAALIYFTGNDIFNRSIRLLASKKGYRLNQRGLFKNVMRGENRVKLTEGELVEGESEEKIFEILGVPYRAPNERCP